LVDYAKLQQMMIAMLEVRPLPLLCSERTKDGVNMHCIWLFAEMIEKANELHEQGSLGVIEALEPERGWVLTEKGILEMMRCLPVVMQEPLCPLKEMLGCAARKDKGAGRAFKGPEEVLDHVLRRHVAPEGQSVLSEASNAIGKKLIEECLSKFIVVDIKGNCDHVRLLSFLSPNGPFNLCKLDFTFTPQPANVAPLQLSIRNSQPPGLLEKSSPFTHTNPQGKPMKEFMLLIRNEIDHQATWSPEQHRQFLKKCMIYIEDLTKHGKLKSAQPLVREGKIVSRSGETWNAGPFNESREVIVGYYHILAKDMDEAITLAKGNPEFEYGTTARIEVRPMKMKEETTQFVYPTKV
jgi:hypothetical protein